VKKIWLIIQIFALTILLMASWSQAQIQRDLRVGYVKITNDAQGGIWNHYVQDLGSWNSAYQPNWEAWVPPGGNTDIGYHGINRDGGGNFSGYGKILTGHSAWWIGTRNWTAPAAGSWGPSGIEGYMAGGQTYDYIVSDNGPVSTFSLIHTPTAAFATPKNLRRVPPPAISVDGIDLRAMAFEDPSQYTVDTKLKTDGMIETEWTDPVGVTFHEKSYAWSHPDYANMVIAEVTITNTGDCNATIAGIEKPDQTLTNFWVGFKHLFACPERWASYSGYYDGEVDWFFEYDPATRYFWSWDGDAFEIPGDDQFDPRGGPLGTADLPTGEYLVPEIVGMAFLHIDRAGDDPTNDIAQPKTFRYVKYADQISGIYHNKHAESYNMISGEDGNALYMKGWGDDPYATQPDGLPHWDPLWGIGPYTLAPGEDIRLVFVRALGTVGEKRAIELGYKVKNESYDPALAKKEIYETGRDRLFAEFEKARDLYFNKNLEAPFIPDPPSLTIVSGPEEVSVTWEPVANAVKYKVYRAVGGYDNGRIFDVIQETTGTEYLDSNLIRGFSYYYYVAAVDANGYESHPYFNRVQRAAVPYRRGLKTDGWAKDVRVVPNPHNVKGGTYLEDATHNSTGYNYDGSLRNQNTVSFVNLPEYCTIRIYNSIGDLIKTLEHSSGSADERWWPVITDDNQIPASGVYFYTIEVTKGVLAGQVGTGKLVIIR